MERAAKERLIGAVVLVSVAWLLIPIFLDDTADDSSDIVERALTLPNADNQTTAGGASAPRRRETLQLREPTPEEPSPQKVTALPVPSESVGSAEAGESQGAENAPDPDPAAILSASQPDTKPVVKDDVSEKPAPAKTETTASRAETASPITPKLVPATTPEPQEQTKPAPVVRPAASASRGLWAVQLGSFGNADNAQKLAADLRRQGLLASVSQVESNGKTLHRVRIGPQANRADSEAIVAELQKKGQVARVVKHP